LIAVVLAAALLAPAPAHASEYAQALAGFLKNWPPPEFQAAAAKWDDDRGFHIAAVRTPQRPQMIGMIKRYTVRAPLADAVALSENVAEFPKLWREVESVKVVSREGDAVVVDWVRKAPAFFLPKIRYRTRSTAYRETPGRVAFLNELLSGNYVKSSDSLVVYESIGPGETRVSVIDLFEPSLGAFQGVVGGKIRKKSFQTALKDDVSFRDRLEHPDWSASRLAKEADSEFDKRPQEAVPNVDLPGIR
jgi:hypothetical protein